MYLLVPQNQGISSNFFPRKTGFKFSLVDEWNVNNSIEDVKLELCVGVYTSRSVGVLQKTVLEFFFKKVIRLFPEVIVKMNSSRGSF